MANQSNMMITDNISKEYTLPNGIHVIIIIDAFLYKKGFKIYAEYGDEYCKHYIHFYECGLYGNSVFAKEGNDALHERLTKALIQ